MLKSRNNIKWKKLHNISHRVNFKGFLEINKEVAFKVQYGDFGLKAISSGFLTFRQIEAARRAITRNTSRNSKLWIRIYPNYSITKKVKNSRMGKGVGSTFLWLYFIKIGTIIFEINKINFKKLYSSFISAAKKLPIKTKIIKRL